MADQLRSPEPKSGPIRALILMTIGLVLLLLFLYGPEVGQFLWGTPAESIGHS